MEFQRLAAAHLEHNSEIVKRDPKHILADMNALHCLAQAAVNVELFTIPLYMTTMYSLYGKHSITEKPPAGQKPLYFGRLWPGICPSPKPKTANDEACNLYFSVFIQEMLHLQMASNICSALGNNIAVKILYGPGSRYLTHNTLHPIFTSDLLVNKNNGWTCYGDDKTTIPHILDLTDLEDTVYNQVKVKLGALDTNSINLALAIEEAADVLCARIKNDARDKYIATKEGGVFANVPFKNWSVFSTESNLPMFGSIATMYECLAAYLNISYDVSDLIENTLSISVTMDDNTTETIEIENRYVTPDNTINLFDLVFNASSLQRDLFNTKSGGHPMAEFPQLDTFVPEGSTAAQAKQYIFQMMNAITDQGEGATMKVKPEPMYTSGLVLNSVEKDYQPDFEALKKDYVQYDDQGNELPVSASAESRYTNGDIDHYERFTKVKALLEAGQLTTWVDWHKQGNQWTAADLETADFENNPLKSAIPSADSVAQALNRLNQAEQRDANFAEMSHVAAGAIAGITTVLNRYWTDSAIDFPFPSMSGSGDRVSICWAVFGQAPDLSLGEYTRIGESHRDYLYHACQGMAQTPQAEDDPNKCASKEVFHTCRGSNQCKAEGGCGFVQKVEGGGSGCRSVAATPAKSTNGCGAPTLYSPPADNACGGLGGCAVPISASQLYPEDGLMPIYTFAKDLTPSKVSGEGVSFKRGQGVYDTAWEAYSKSLEAESKTPESKPEPSDLRLAFPPST
ncbi:ferritin-like domain-containing protein [Marinomonas fungiae]|uniref:ferritin-like domain-containing protein n=1 Tax=Marinomonas fungiae TaxID=1137284 RepID=UPI003A93C74F